MIGVPEAVADAVLLSFEQLHLRGERCGCLNDLDVFEVAETWCSDPRDFPVVVAIIYEAIKQAGE